MTNVGDLAGQAVCHRSTAPSRRSIRVNAAILATAGLTPDDVQGETVAGNPPTLHVHWSGGPRVVSSASIGRHPDPARG